MLNIKLGPLMTADEAKTRYCPAMTRADAHVSCGADQCMWWMWLEELRRGMVPHEQDRSILQELLEARETGRRIGFCCK